MKKNSFKNTDPEEKIFKICEKLFWPVAVAWLLCALAKIMIDFGLIT